MQQQKVNLDEMILVGKTIRTHFDKESHPETSGIAKLAAEYFGNQIAESIQHHLHPQVTYSAYTEYETNEYGAYTYTSLTSRCDF